MGLAPAKGGSVRVIALMVTKNEADRYLDAVVRWTKEAVDAVVLYDDRSEDDTAQVAANAGAIVGVRQADIPTFMENESQFRMAAWMFAGKYCDLTTDDFVVCVDADEFLLTIDHDSLREGIGAAIKCAESESCDVVDIPVAEVFEMAGDRPLTREDGQWGKIRAARIARWQRKPLFRDAKLAGGSIPQIAGPPLRIGDPVLLHAGYRRYSDRVAKHARYTGVKGHGSNHVRSIMEHGIYTPWPHPLPPLIAEALKEDR